MRRLVLLPLLLALLSPVAAQAVVPTKVTKAVKSRLTIEVGGTKAAQIETMTVTCRTVRRSTYRCPYRVRFVDADVSGTATVRRVRSGRLAVTLGKRTKIERARPAAPKTTTAPASAPAADPWKSNVGPSYTPPLITPFIELYAAARTAARAVLGPDASVTDCQRTSGSAGAGETFTCKLTGKVGKHSRDGTVTVTVAPGNAAITAGTPAIAPRPILPLDVMYEVSDVLEARDPDFLFVSTVYGSSDYTCTPDDGQPLNGRSFSCTWSNGLAKKAFLKGTASGSVSADGDITLEVPEPTRTPFSPNPSTGGPCYIVIPGAGGFYVC